MKKGTFKARRWVAAAVSMCLGVGFAQASFGQSARPDTRALELGKDGLPLLGATRDEMRHETGTQVTGFAVGSLSYASRHQLVPEFAGGVPALADAGSTNFRFDKFGLSLSRSFAPWLYATAAVEVESHRDAHSHGFDPAFGCPGAGTCIERFGAEEPETEANLDRFSVTAVAPVGNGLSLSLGRVDVPFGIERHDEPLNLTATTSEVFRFGRPQRMTGFQVAYQFSPSLDVAAWVSNRWESETTHTGFDDNNKGKSIGGRIGFSPRAEGSLLNVGIGGFWGPEQDEDSERKRWVLDVDFTWSPRPSLLFAGEFILGAEDKVSFRERGIPFPAPAVADKDVKWQGFYLLAHYDLREWLGLSLRYGRFEDTDGARTGVEQTLQSLSLAPIVHLSRLVPGLRPSGATYARTRHPIDWVDLKIEYRYDWSDRPVFSDAPPATDILSAEKHSHQLQLQAVVNF